MTNESYEITSTQFHEHLDSLQFEQELDDAKFLIVDLEPQEIGEQITRQMLGLQLGFILNRTVVFKPPEGKPVSSYYQPFSKFAYQDIADIPAVPASFDIEQFDKVVHFDYRNFWDNHRLRRYFYPWAPPAFVSLKCGRLIFDGEILARFRLQEDFSHLVEESKALTDSDQLTIGLYAHETVENSETPSVPLSELVERISRISEESGAKRILVAGDSEDALAELPQGFETTYISDDTDDSNTNPQSLSENSAENDRRAYGVLREFELLSSCDWIVGRGDADIARHAAARIGLRTFRCDRHRLIGNQAENRRLGRRIRKK